MSEEALDPKAIVEGAEGGSAAGELPEGVLVARVGAGANCSSAGSAIDILFYTSVIAGAIAVALSAAFPPRGAVREGGGGEDGPGGGGPARPEGPASRGSRGDDAGDEAR